MIPSEKAKLVILHPDMFKRTIHPSEYFLIAANILPVIGVLAWGWSPIEVFIVYCLETIIIGILTLVKMGIVTITRNQESWQTAGGKSVKPGLALMIFFIFHYGMFVAIQMGLFFSVSGIASKANIGFFNFFYKWPSLLNKDALIMLIAFFFCYGFKMLVDFIFTGKYKTATLAGLMFEPYIRIFIQQFTVILGSIFLTFGAGKIFIIIFAMIKIAFELFIDYGKIINEEKLEQGFQSDNQ